MRHCTHEPMNDRQPRGQIIVLHGPCNIAHGRRRRRHCFYSIYYCTSSTATVTTFEVATTATNAFATAALYITPQPLPQLPRSLQPLSQRTLRCCRYRLCDYTTAAAAKTNAPTMYRTSVLSTTELPANVL
ncbi:unnamed protein product [Laminaria digitata]